MARVTVPHGRIVIGAWLPTGTVSHVVRMARPTFLLHDEYTPPEPTGGCS